MKSQSYNFEIKDLLTQFIAAFDDVVIKRYDNKRVAQEKIEVRYVLAPKQRVMYDIVNKAQNLTLPVVAINVTGISRDTTRVFNKLDNIYNPITERSNSSIKMPVPINIEISMSVLARYMQDMDQILSNFIPYNNPYIILSWQEPIGNSSKIVEIRSEVLWGGSISLTEPTDTAYTDKFRIVADTSFTIKGWLFKDQNTISKQIYFIDANLIATRQNELLIEDSYDKLLEDASKNLDVDTISISAIPAITDIFYNPSGTLHNITSEFTIQKQLTSYNNFILRGINFKYTNAILLSSNSNITNNVSAISSKYTGATTGHILNPSQYNILNDDMLSINLPYLSGSGSFNFIINNEAGWTSSYTINNFTFVNL